MIVFEKLQMNQLRRNTRKSPDLTGRTFGQLTVEQRLSKVGAHSIVYRCRCSCGKVTTPLASNLMNGLSASCGCSRITTQFNRRSHKKYPDEWQTYKTNARKKDRDFTLTSDSFTALIEGSCVYCGKAGPGGIDRVDNALGYTESNCVSACTTCNIAKKTLTLDEFKAWIDRVHKKLFPVDT